MFREYSVSNELYTDTVKKLSAANRKIYRLKKQLSNQEVIISGKVEKYKNEIWIDDRTFDNFIFELEQALYPIVKKKINQYIKIIISKGDSDE